MKIVCTIPARYKSSRFPGKPLADLFGKPMIWWVYQKVKTAKGIHEAYVATDSEIIKDACEGYSIPVVMTIRKTSDGRRQNRRGRGKDTGGLLFVGSRR